jgi:hypothetical protein
LRQVDSGAVLICKSGTFKLGALEQRFRETDLPSGRFLKLLLLMCRGRGKVRPHLLAPHSRSRGFFKATSSRIAHQKLPIHIS